MKNFTIAGLTPFETTDCQLTLSLEKTGALPVLHLGRDKQKAITALREVTKNCRSSFGVCFATDFSSGIEPHNIDAGGIDLPPAVSHVIAPFDLQLSLPSHIRLFRQIHTLQEARRSLQEGVAGIIVKGNEGAGFVSNESSFILFQKIRTHLPDAEIWVQGGIGVHTTAALAALGAAGVILDSQLVLFPGCAAPQEVKKLCSRLNGNETRLIDHFRVLVRPNSPTLSGNTSRHDLQQWLGPLDPSIGYLPMGQDIALAHTLVQQYQTLDQLIFGIRQAVYGHLRQAKAQPVIAPGNALSRALNLSYPIAQGPMTRVSDVPAFAAAVAENGALPFVALSLLQGEDARRLVGETRRLAGEKTWGIGILGFAPPELRQEQLNLLLGEKPPVVLIAGGRPSQAKPLEDAGIRVFLHVPSPTLLDLFIREGARNFVFEGRECGGHVGPLSSLVLWEAQIARLLQEEDAGAFSIFFAGGIHDAFSAAFIAVMAAPLAAKGARVGVLMGTAYLYTQEAVSTGAIVRQFQQQAVEHSETVLLETAPGHETRCLRTPFTGTFQREKERLIQNSVDKQDIWSTLEQLNVGRLRIAAKGIERREDRLVPIGEEQQHTQGMYMIGQVVTLKQELTTLAELHRNVAQGNALYIENAILPTSPRDNTRALDVAIIGIACIYPGARNVHEYWANILQGKDCVTQVPEERWNLDLYYDPQGGDGKTNSKWGGFLPTVDFDPLEFGIPPQSLAAIEPTQLLALLTARDALRDAGYEHKAFPRENTSVIVAAEGGTDLSNNYAFRNFFKQVFGDLPPAVDNALPRLTEDSFPGILANVIAGRICNRLDLGGRNYSVDAACASSLAAVDLACQELQLGKADMVLAGAADLHNTINDYLLFSSTRALSSTGRCMTFDTAADGIVLGEGIAMLVLKRHADALRDGDRIYALIQGVGGSSDGKSLGLTAPRKKGQWKALERAYHQAGISPADIGLVEAHGTGTVVGDKTELSALTDLFIQSGALASQTTLGSVKSQIGHTKCAAGLAGLIKAALSVFHGIKPPTLHLQQPNSFYHPTLSPFSFHLEAAPWNASSRIAGVSAFGFGGTNFHVVLENARDTTQTPTTASAIWPSELLVFRGETYAEAHKLLSLARTTLLQNDSIALRDIAYSLYRYNDHPVQLSIVADNADDLLLKLDLALSGATAGGIFVTKPVQGKLAFLFPGQGSQRVNMARSLLTTLPVLRRMLKVYPHYEAILFPPAAFEEPDLERQKNRIRDTRLAQPLLGIIDLAIAGFLHQLDIIPDMAAGHSYGELPALCFAGAMAEDALVSLSEKRAQAILDAAGSEKGTMIAIICPETTLTPLLRDHAGIYAVNHNSPHQWVLAGSTADIHHFTRILQGKNISFQPLQVDCAFHSPLLAAAETLFATSLREIPFSAPKIPVWSNTTANTYPPEAEAIRGALATHLVRPVQFAREIENMVEAGARLFIEVGPGKALSNLTRAITGKEEYIWHTEDKNGLTHLLHVIAAYMSTGRKASLGPLFEDRSPRCLDLDHPESYKKSNTAWFVNGQLVKPAHGPLPAHGAPPITKPITMNNTSISTLPSSNGPASNSAERLMEEYLQSIKLLVQAQRDVMLGYLGQLPPAPASIAAPSFPAHAIAMTTSHHPEITPVAEQLPTPTHPSPNRDNLQQLLLSVVAEKTGYPADMLGLDLDMESDLSIDSIKRTEIIGELVRHLTIAGDREKTLEKLASLKTLGSLLTWLENAITKSAPIENKNADHKTALNQSAESAPNKLLRLRLEWTPTSLKAKNSAHLHGHHFALIGETGPIATAICETLATHGATGFIDPIPDQLTQCDGLILLDLFDSPHRPDILASFSLIQKLDPKRIKWIYALSDHYGQLRKTSDTRLLRHFQGYPGFLRSLAKEWEHARCGTIHINGDQSPAAIAATVLDELTNTDHHPEVIYHDTLRQTASWVPAELTPGPGTSLALDPGSIVLAFGGAQGITAELMIRLSREYPCRYILVGRSPDPQGSAHELSTIPESKELIRQWLIHQGELTNPAGIERRTEQLFKSKQILQTLRALQNNGATATYHSLDLRDAEGLQRLITGLYLQYGRIDGVIHGAGLIEDKLFHLKTPESFERVFATKVTPLHILAETLRPDTKFVVLFSSIASAYGNRGQTDYAAANSVLDHYAWQLGKKINGRMLSINWGPWKGAGMVSPALETEYAKRGISLIPLPAGMESFLDELRYGSESQVLIMAG